MRYLWWWFKTLIYLQPHVVIGGGVENQYLRRWWIIPKNRYFNIFLHKFLQSDDDRALHDHPWRSLSIILKGKYLDHKHDSISLHKAGSFIYRRANQAHRISKVDSHPVWTLFITGSKVREWGFWCPQGWIHWKEFTSSKNGEMIGRGCD